ncbi:MAG: hypothetical protein SFU56_00635, partial [Capsulimonadales bacterium]|nr:hypothetical protein [Capsulimonadales bacterium]
VLGFVDELLAGERVEISVANATPRFAERIRTLVPGSSLVGGAGMINAKDEPGLVASVIDMAREENTRIVSIIPKRRTLEDLFVEIVGERISAVEVDAQPSATLDSPEVEAGLAAGGNQIQDDVSTVVTTEGEGARKRPAANKYKELNRQ